MRGPHNIWRLVRTGATLERTGAMRAVLDAMEAPRALRMTARILGWPFAWLGLKGDATMPPAPRALSALGPAYIKFGQIHVETIWKECTNVKKKTIFIIEASSYQLDYSKIFNSPRDT